MNNMRFRDTVDRFTLTDEFGYTFSVAVPVTVTEFWMDGQWEPTLNGEEMRKVEAAVEKAYPGWYHRCYDNPEGPCPACQRKAEARRLGLTERKVVVN